MIGGSTGPLGLANIVSLLLISNLRLLDMEGRLSGVAVKISESSMLYECCGSCWLM